jgi:hypothetical protein
MRKRVLILRVISSDQKVGAPATAAAGASY